MSESQTVSFSLSATMMIWGSTITICGLILTQMNFANRDVQILMNKIDNYQMEWKADEREPTRL